MSKMKPKLFLLSAMIGIIAVATLSSCTKVKNPSATEKEIPILTFKGKVLNPDGTPAGRCVVMLSGIAVTTDPLSLSALEASCCPSAVQSFCTETNEHTTTFSERMFTDAAGNFEFTKVAPAGAEVTIYAVVMNDISLHDPTTFVTEPFVFIAEKDLDDLTIQLQEGIRVDGMALFDNGIPAVGQMVMATSIRFPMSFGAQVQADGTFELSVPPSDFHIEGHRAMLGIHPDDDSRRVFISVKNQEEDYHVDLVFPAMPHGKFVKEDGSAPGTLFRLHVANFGGSGIAGVRPSIPMMPGGEFALVTKEKGNSLIALTEDGLLGVIHSIPDEELEKFQTVVLKPTAIATLRFLDASDQPLAGQQIQVRAGLKLEGRGGDGGLLPSTTDADGIATIRLPPGTADYRLTWADGGKMEFNRTLQSGDVIDLGTVEMK